MTQQPYQAWEEQQRRNTGAPEVGKLGYFVDGEFRIKVEGDLSLYWVRFEPSGYAAFPHKGRVHAPDDLSTYESQNIRVEVGYDLQGDRSILGFAQAELNAQLQHNENLFVQDHSQGIETIYELAGMEAEGMVHRIDTDTFEVIKTNLAAGGAPTINDDSADGYGVYSVWLYAGDLYIATDVTPGAAVWKRVTNLTTEELQDIIAAFVVGSTNIAATYNDPGNTLTLSITGQIPIANGGTAAADAANARINLGLAIGVNVQAYSALLSGIAALGANGLIARTGAGAAAARTLTGTAPIAVANGDGAAGNPAVSLDTASLPEDTAPNERTTYSILWTGTIYEKVELSTLRASRTSNYNVGSPPSDWDFRLAFGGVRDGFHAVLQDNGSGTKYQVWYVNGRWGYSALTDAGDYKALWDKIPEIPGWLVHWAGKDADTARMRATNPAFAIGRNIMIDGAMDEATTARYTTNASATLSKVSTTRHDATTGLVLRATNTAVNGGASQAVTGIGRVYKYSVRIRSDGTVSQVLLAGTNTYATLAVTGSWQLFEGYFISLASATVALLMISAAAGAWIEIDEWSIQMVDIKASTAYDPTTGRIEMVVDGALNYGVFWSFTHASVTISGGKMHFAATPISQGANANGGLAYLSGSKSWDVTYTISNYSGSGGFRTSVGGTNATLTRTANGTYTDTIIGGGDGIVRFRVLTAALTCDVDDISIVPTNGKLIDNGDFANWASATNADVWGEGLAGTSTINRDTDVPAGSPYTFSARFDVDASNNLTNLSQAGLKPGGKYQVKFWAKASAGGLSIATDSGIFTPVTLTTSWVQYTLIGSAINIAFNIKRNNLTSSSAWITGIEVIEINPLDATCTGVSINPSAPAALGGKAVVFNGSAVVNLYSHELNAIFTPAQIWAVQFLKLNSIISLGQFALRLSPDTNNGVDFRQLDTTSWRLRYQGQADSANLDTPHGGNITNPVMLDLTADVGGNLITAGLNGVQYASDNTPTLLLGNLLSTTTLISGTSTANASPLNADVHGVALFSIIPATETRLAVAALAGVAAV